MYPKKSLGQNFLMHVRTAARIADAAELDPSDVVLEVGPGRGALTRELVKRAAKVIAIEADHELFEKLSVDLAPSIREGLLDLRHGDIRESDLSAFPNNYVVAANIPYYLTGELFRMFLSAENQPRSMTLLVQKEVADRIALSEKESILSLSVKAYGVPKRKFTVSRGSFVPMPNVDSAVLHISGISRANFRTRAHESRFFELLHAGFAHKRKLLKGNLAGLVSASHIPEKARAEDMPLQFWLELSRG